MKAGSQDNKPHYKWKTLKLSTGKKVRQQNSLRQKKVKQQDSLHQKRLNNRIAYAGGTQNRLSWIT